MEHGAGFGRQGLRLRGKIFWGLSIHHLGARGLGSRGDATGCPISAHDLQPRSLPLGHVGVSESSPYMSSILFGDSMAPTIERLYPAFGV